jgi:hypothetical protein
MARSNSNKIELASKSYFDYSRTILQMLWTTGAEDGPNVAVVETLHPFGASSVLLIGGQNGIT